MATKGKGWTKERRARFELKKANGNGHRNGHEPKGDSLLIHFAAQWLRNQPDERLVELARQGLLASAAKGSERAPAEASR